jgi:hypothetical protein
MIGGNTSLERREVNVHPVETPLSYKQRRSLGSASDRERKELFHSV